MNDADVFEHDTVMLEEIEMLTELVITATQCSGRLPQDEVDNILGVERTHILAAQHPSLAPCQGSFTHPDLSTGRSGNDQARH
jgi:hypothetical protein